MDIRDQLQQKRDEAHAAAVRWDDKTKHSRYGCISDQEHSTELWRKVQKFDWQVAELARNTTTTGAHQ